jgi:hypothetical protein
VNASVGLENLESFDRSKCNDVPIPSFDRESNRSEVRPVVSSLDRIAPEQVGVHPTAAAFTPANGTGKCKLPRLQIQSHCVRHQQMFCRTRFGRNRIVFDSQLRLILTSK